MPNVTSIKGYSETNGASSSTYNSGTTITPTKNMTLYAVYKATYNVYIYHNNFLYKILSCYEGGSVTLPSMSEIVGYATSNTSDEVTYNNGQTISPSGNISLYTIANVSFSWF